MASDVMESPAADLVAAQFEAINRHDPQAFAALYGANAVVLDPQYPEPLKGRDAVARDIADFLTAFPDLRMERLLILEGADGHAVEYTMHGTHKGPLIGPSGHIPATNKRIEVGGSALVRRDASGRIAHERRYYDLAGLLAQLGLMR